MPGREALETIEEHARHVHHTEKRSEIHAFPSRSSQTTSSTSATTATGPVPLGYLTDRATVWLEDRGIDPELASRIGIESAASGSGGNGRIEWIAFPFVSGGTIVNRKYRRIDKKDFRMDPGCPQTWFNGDVISDKTLADVPLVITEGEADCAIAIQCGYVRSVSVPGGAPSIAGSEGNAKYAFVADSLDALRSCRDVIIAADGDHPGMNLLQDLSIRIGRGRCKYVTYPDGCKDLNDVFLRHGGRSGVIDVLGNARWCHVPGLFRMSELQPVPYAKPHHTFIDGLGEHFNMRKGDFTVITGVPGGGKSTFINDLCCRMAYHHQWRTCFASFEQSPQIDHRRALRTWHGKRLERDMEQRQIVEADAWIDQFFSFLIPEEDADADIDWILDKFASAVIRYGTDICVIDPWNEMDHVRPGGQSLTEYVGHAIKQMKKFAKKWNVHLIVAAHPAKMYRDKEGKMPIPGLYDIADCYSDDTEALTNRGWLRHEEITTDDVVMCFDPKSGGSMWAHPSRIVSHEYNGNMINFRGYGFDILVSPNHRMLVKPYWKEPVGTQKFTGRGRPVKWPKGEWSFVNASELASIRAPFTIPKAALAQNGDNPEHILVHGRKLPALEFMNLVGWWIAEGSVQGCGLSLCQAEGPDARKIDALIAACGLDVSRAASDDRRGFKRMVKWYFGAKTCQEVVRWMKEEVGSGSANKRIPIQIWNMHPSIKASLLDGYISGDGHRPKRRSGFSSTTTSKVLFDDLMRLAVELGIPVCGHEMKKVRPHHSRSWQINYGTDLRSEVIIEPKRNSMIVPYNGKIWCLTVPTGAYFVRRNGKVSVSGNSAHFVNKPDAGIIVHPAIDDGCGEHTIVRVAKSRYRDQIGRPGEIKLRFDRTMSRFFLLDDAHMGDDDMLTSTSTGSGKTSPW